MKILENKRNLDELLGSIGVKGLKIGLIPTMGSIHEGHLSLVERSKKNKYFSIVTIFVNPTQFDNLEDFKKYPKSKKKDIQKLKNINCDALYFPTLKDVYPNKVASKKTIFKFRNIMCDKFRPGHFDGVSTVVKCLFELIKPDMAFFGEKDLQQLKIIESLVEKDNLEISIKSCPSIRMKNGMSYSSRYLNFSTKQKKIFQNVAKIINKYVKIFKIEINIDYLNKLKKELNTIQVNKIDYLEIRDEKKLKTTNIYKNARLFVAFHIDNIRIIDNFILY